MASSEGGGIVFDDEATSQHSSSMMVGPVGQTIVWLAMNDTNNTAIHTPGVLFPFSSTTCISFLLPTHPLNLSQCILACVHLVHICPGTPTPGWLFFSQRPHFIACAMQPDSSCVDGTSAISILLLSLAMTWKEY